MYKLLHKFLFVSHNYGTHKLYDVIIYVSNITTDKYCKVFMVKENIKFRMVCLEKSFFNSSCSF